MLSVENPVSMHDRHATILYLLGIDHHEFTFRYNGREQTLTKNLGAVIRDVVS